MYLEVLSPEEAVEVAAWWRQAFQTTAEPASDPDDAAVLDTSPYKAESA